jgi:hypothetical protein
VNLFLMLPEADGAFLEAVTGCPGSPLRDIVGIGDFRAGGPFENQRLLLHGALSVTGGGPGFAESWGGAARPGWLSMPE